MKPVIVAILSIVVATSAWAVIDDLENIGDDGTDVTVRLGRGTAAQGAQGLQIDISSTGNFLGARTYGAASPRSFGSAGDPNNPSAGPISGTRFISTASIGTGSTLFQNVEPISFAFNMPLQAFGLKTAHLLRSTGAGDAEITLTGFDSSGGVVATHSISGAQAESSPTLSLVVSSLGLRPDNSPAITRAELSGTAAGGYGIDDLIYVVPEPASLALFAAGTVGLMLRRRRAA